MKSTKASDHWRRVYSREYVDRVDRISYSEILGLTDGDISFAGGISVVVGANGAGKSTVLSALLATLRPAAVADAPSRPERLKAATIRIWARRSDEPYELTYAPIDPDSQEPPVEPTLPVTMVNPGLDSAWLIRLFRDEKDLEELLAAYQPAPLEASDLELASYVIGRNYEKIEAYEIPDYESYPPFPYFRTTVDGVTYGSEDMGLGEMSVHLTLWTLRQAPRRSVLLLEEPEAFVSPRSQQRLMDVVAKLSDERRIWTIVTTHSAAIARAVPIKHVRLLVRQSGNVDVIGQVTDQMLRIVLGMRSGFEGCLLVEDRCAKAFLMSLLRRLAPEILRTHEVVIGDGHSPVRMCLQAFPETQPWLSLVAVLDGDQRTVPWEGRWPATYLPGQSGPEALLKRVASAQADQVSARVARTADEVRVALSEVEGLDLHDWLTQLCRHLSIEVDATIDAFVDLWLQSPDSAAEADATVSELRIAIERSFARPLARPHMPGTSATVSRV